MVFVLFIIVYRVSLGPGPSTLIFRLKGFKLNCDLSEYSIDVYDKDRNDIVILNHSKQCTGSTHYTCCYVTPSPQWKAGENTITFILDSSACGNIKDEVKPQYCVNYIKLCCYLLDTRCGAVL